MSRTWSLAVTGFEKRKKALIPPLCSVSELQLAVKRHPLKSGEGSVNETLSGLSKYCICPDYLLGRWKIVLSGGKASHSQA
ncbi:hypothetical protein Y1Q_0003364 [Alligator mississippiensis]|uniref:Uncharacterized protein n=1 Tax=Alligator mississippiensis TaxID=8496 RepID=A0A151MAW7_ALLMI|nr:hypothetical protein Y1Q_0003364 [Alligator mississippiensis]